LTGELEAQAPKGMGRLTYDDVETEVAAWDRFKNRRQAGSYAGLTGGVSASGQGSADLSITRAGSRCLRTDLVELAWRLLLYPLPRTILLPRKRGDGDGPRPSAARFPSFQSVA